MTQSIFFDVIARDRASSTFSRVGKASDTAHGRLLKFSKGALGAAAGFTSITLAAGAFVRVGADYVGSLNKIQALTGANDATVKRAAKTLESSSSAYAKMGQTVGDAAGGVVELTKSGLSLNKSLTAVNATMVLAKAGELDVADASALVANTLNTFSLKANRAGDIANYLANAANISSADVSDLAESLKYVAPVAASTGVSLKQTNAILAELSNSGIKASNAGTGFRKFLLSLQAPSAAAAKDLKGLGVQIFDASGKMKPLGDVIDILDGKLSKLTDEKRQKILKDVFGLQGVSAAQVILKNGSKGLETYTKGITKAGAAQKLAEASSKGFAGTLSALRAETISTAQAAYRELSPKLDEAAQKLLAFIEQMKDGKGAGGDFVAAIKALGSVVGTALRVLNELPGPVKRFGAEALIAYVVLRKLTSATSGFGSSLAVPIARTKQMYAEMTYAETRMQAVKTASYALGSALRQVGGTAGMLAVVDGAKRTSGALSTLELTAGGAAAGFAVGGPLGAAVGGAIGYTAALTKEIRQSGRAFDDHLSSARNYAGTLDEVTAATTRATRAMVLERLEKSGTLAATEKLKISDRDAVQAALGNVSARRRLTKALRDAVAAGSSYEALKIAQSLGVETSAINDSRVAQLQKNLALAKTDAQAARIQAKLDKLGRTNANARLTLTGADPANRKLTSTEQLLHDIGKARPNPTVSANISPAQSRLNQLEARLQRLASKVYTATVNILTFHSDGGSKTGRVGHNATGTSNWRGGMTWVGEKGPELVNLPQGSAVYPADKSARMAAGAGGGGEIVGYLEVVHKTPDGKTIETELVQLKNTRGGLRPLAFQ